MEERVGKMGFKAQKEPNPTIRDILETIKQNLNKDDHRQLIHLGHGDPSSYPSFKTTHVADEAIRAALRSAKFNGYAPAAGIPAARRAIAEYLSGDLPYELCEEDVSLTAGANHGIEILLSVLAQPTGANVLLPRPGYPLYEARASFSNLQVRHFDLLPDKGWEVDLNAVEALADDNTVAMVIINPGNPCGNVYTYQHLQKIAETAKKLGIIVIADEVYAHLVYGGNKFTPMGVFGSIVPVLSLGSISKRWLIPGWRLGWIAAMDPNGILKSSGIVKCMESYLNITADSATFIQGAVPEILERSTETFFTETVSLLKQVAGVCYAKVSEIPAITCTSKPEGAMSTMVKINLELLEGIENDLDFAFKLAKEESVLVLPGSCVGLKNWLRLSYAVELVILEEGLERIKAFCLRHSKK